MLARIQGDDRGVRRGGGMRDVSHVQGDGWG